MSRLQNERSFREACVARDIDKREAILEAALDLFGEYGFHGTAVPQIADRAGVGAGTIYRYFDSKEALVNTLFQSWKLRLLASIMDGFPLTAPLREQFHVLWSRWGGFVVQHPKVALFLELHHHQPYLDAHSHAIEERVVGLVIVLLEQGRAQRVVRDVPCPVLMALLHGIMVGLVRAHADKRLVLDAPTLDLAERCAWEAIRA
jgi:TetR/AcrR family transcriptional regulator, repressor of fatR-cypB operon